MHNKLPAFFLFIDVFHKEHIRKLDKKIAIIYINYSLKLDKELVLKIKSFCKRDGRKFFLSNNFKLAVKLDLDGVYIPSYNTELKINSFSKRKKFLIIGSAHNLKEIKIKEKQGAQIIFLSPLFKTNKTNKFLGSIKFNMLSKMTDKKLIALGGINQTNIQKLFLLNAYGFASISFLRNADKLNINRVITKQKHHINNITKNK